ncbi:MAG: DNA repair protein RadC [Planctomycetales bacterium]|nr:DNA repair protein RadC [Planctomycetales bacterium]
MNAKTAKSSSAVRYERYRAVIELVCEQQQFSVAEVKQSCTPERPAFVTKVVNELLTDGWLLREATPDTYCWNTDRGSFSPQRWLDDKLFGNQVKTAPEQDRPRERLLAVGPEQLKVAELLAILIRSGRPGESAVTAGQKLAQRYDGRLADLVAAGRAELKAISPAVEKTAYCQIMAGIELGRRVAACSEPQRVESICSPTDAIAYCRQRFARLASDAKQEEFHIVTLNTKNHVIDTHRITVGTLDASLVHPREVFRPAIKDAASSVLLVHNHPSGDPTPSREDHAVTNQLTEAGKLLGIEVLDHIVLGKGTAISIRQQ